MAPCHHALDGEDIIRLINYRAEHNRWWNFTYVFLNNSCWYRDRENPKSDANVKIPLSRNPSFNTRGGFLNERIGEEDSELVRVVIDMNLGRTTLY